MNVPRKRRLPYKPIHHRIGERGPETIRMVRGASVLPASEAITRGRMVRVIPGERWQWYAMSIESSVAALKEFRRMEREK